MVAGKPEMAIIKTDNIWGNEYLFETRHKKRTQPSAPKIIIVSYMFNEASTQITRLAVESIKKFTREEHEIWISDNNSPKENFEWVANDPEINFIRNLTVKDYRSVHDSLLNALGIEAGARAIDPKTKYAVVMHSDIVVADEKWLNFALNKLDDKTKGVGFLIDNTRINAMHVSGTLFAFDLYKKYDIDFRPSPPNLDVGDDITRKIRENGLQYTYCRNSHNDSKVIDEIDKNSIFKNMHSDRTIDDSGKVIFAHLGRGTPKANQTYFQKNKTTAEQWIHSIKNFLTQ